MTTVRSIMQADVLTVRPDVPVRELARLLSDRGISGAPVVGSDGRLQGVVSATDVVRLAAEEVEVRASSVRWTPLGSGGGPASDGDGGWPEDEGEGRGWFLPEEGLRLLGAWDAESVDTALDGSTVADIMTATTFTVSPDATVQELADFLLRGRIHRAVVEKDGRPVGIVTAFDVLRVVAAGEGAGGA